MTKLNKQMGFVLSQEQQDIILAIRSNNYSLIKINAVAGAAKSSTLKAIALDNTDKNITYIVFSKEQQLEAKREFPSNTEPRTIHSLALEIVKTALPDLQIGYISYKDIKANIAYEVKLSIIDAFDKFCLSKFLSIKEFMLKTNISKDFEKHIKSLMEKTINGDIKCTHNAYLKLAVIFMNKGTVSVTEKDMLFLDEAGDTSGCAIMLFELISAKIKILVGDSEQAIFSFMYLENAFVHFHGKGITLHLTTSFRCSENIAAKIQAFSREYIDDKFIFNGTTYTNPTNTTTCYISRTNSALIDRILRYEEQEMPYNLTRDPKYSFQLINDLASLSDKHERFVSDGEFNYINEDLEEYYRSMALQSQYKTPLKYINFLHGDNQTIKSTTSLIGKHGNSKIWAMFESAKRNYKRKIKASTTLSTAHSSKGLSFDTVIILEDFNKYIEDGIQELIEAPDSKDAQERMRLAYVVLSRARHTVKDCSFWNMNSLT